MKSRIECAHAAPAGVKALYQMENYVKHSGLEPRLLGLVKTRVSQINGCAYSTCTPRTPALGAKRSNGFTRLMPRRHSFPKRERAGLAWVETVTRVAETHAPDEAFEHARQHFTEKELVDLTLAIVAINGCNRLAIAFRKVPGAYQSGEH